MNRWMTSSRLCVSHDSSIKICAARQRLGKPILAPDAWIAATAVRHACPLVTHNQDDYADVAGLIVITAGG